MNLAKLTEMTEAEARQYLERLRWPDGPICPKKGCGCVDIVSLESDATRRGLKRCKACRKQFTVTVGTIFERSHIPLRKWVAAFHLMCSSKKGISALQLQRNLGLGSYKSAWHMAHRIRYAMKQEPLRSKLRGAVEVDETYIGGKSRKGRRGRGSERKTAVVALVQRNGRATSHKVERVGSKELKSAILQNVRADSTIYTDENPAYKNIGRRFKGGHKTIKHSHEIYAIGDITTNTVESYFALMKRGIHGAYHHVSKRHLDRYCDEFSFRWNYRKVTDGERTEAALRQAPGRRLMYREPTAR